MQQSKLMEMLLDSRSSQIKIYSNILKSIKTKKYITYHFQIKDLIKKVEKVSQQSYFAEGRITLVISFLKKCTKVASGDLQ